MDALIIVIAALVAGICIGAAYMDNRHTHQENRDLRARITTLEAAQAKHLSYKSMEAIEDFTAAVIYTEQAFEVAKLHLERAHELGKIARNPEGVKK